MATSRIIDLLRAAIRDDEATVARLTAELGDIDGPQEAGRVAALFGLAAQRAFGTDVDVRTITAYVSAVRAELADPADLPPLEAEALIRAALGESHMADHVPQPLAVPAQIILSVKMLREANLSAEELEQLFSKAETLLRRYGG